MAVLIDYSKIPRLVSVLDSFASVGIPINRPSLTSEEKRVEQFLKELVLGGIKDFGDVRYALQSLGNLAMRPFFNYKTGGVDFSYERALLFRDLLVYNGFDKWEVQSLYSAIVALWLRDELALLKERSRGKYTHRVDYTRFSLRSGLRGLYDYGIVSLYTAPNGWKPVHLSFPDEILRRLMIPANGLFQLVSSHRNTLYLLDGACEGVYVGLDGVLAPTINQSIAQGANYMGYKFQFLLETVFEGILTYIFECIGQTMYQNDVKVSWVGVDGLTLLCKDGVDVSQIIPPELRVYVVEPKASMLDHFLY